jgi:hypothetical protein
MKHSRVRSLLYEYMRGELPRDEMTGIRDHLDSCGRCAREADEIRAAIGLTEGRISAPSDQRPAEYWDNFAGAVERRIQTGATHTGRATVSVFDAVAGFFRFRPAPVAVLGGALALGVCVLVLLRSFHGPDAQSTSPAGMEEKTVQPAYSAGVEDRPVQVLPVDARIGDYFRKMKVLLVGITHLKSDEEHPVDLSSESKVSRELLDQARYLKNQPLDIRSAKLIDDLQKILIQLANTRGEDGRPNVEIIRNGIHRENLLFKIRMAEALCDSSRFILVRDNY